MMRKSILAISLAVLVPLAGAQTALAQTAPVVLAQATPPANLPRPATPPAPAAAPTVPTPPAPAAAAAPKPAAAAAATPSSSRSVPEPYSESDLSDYRIAAIAVGAVGGVIVANALTAGMITPILVAGSNGATIVTGGGYALAAGQTAITVAGALIGGYVGNWIYGPKAN